MKEKIVTVAAGLVAQALNTAEGVAKLATYVREEVEALRTAASEIEGQATHISCSLKGYASVLRGRANELEAQLVK